MRSFFFKKQYQELLDKIEIELINKYEKFYKMSVEEHEFQEYINTQIERWKVQCQVVLVEPKTNDKWIDEED